MKISKNDIELLMGAEYLCADSSCDDCEQFSKCPLEDKNIAHHKLVKKLEKHFIGYDSKNMAKKQKTLGIKRQNDIQAIKLPSGKKVKMLFW